MKTYAELTAQSQAALSKLRAAEAEVRRLSTEYLDAADAAGAAFEREYPLNVLHHLADKQRTSLAYMSRRA